MSNQKENVLFGDYAVIIVFFVFFFFLFFSEMTQELGQGRPQKNGLPTTSVSHLSHPINGELCCQKLSRE